MYFVISYNYRNSDVNLRSRLSHLELSQLGGYREVFLLKTCNRIEFLFNRKPNLEKLYRDILSPYLTPQEFENGEFYQGEEAVFHIFKVASSLDSMVVGETQITGQLKEAFMEAYEQGFVGKDLTRLLHFSFKCAKRVRNLTHISEEPVSVASIAVREAKRILGDLSGYSAVVVGVGDTARIVCKNLVKEGVNILLVNRSIENAFALREELGDEVNIDVHPLDALPKLLNSYRLLFTATSAPYPIIRQKDIKETKFHRLWFDLAIPSDIEGEIGCPNIQIVRVDDLKEISEANRRHREKQVEEGLRLLRRCVQEFYEYLQMVSIEPVIKLLHQKAEEASRQALKTAIKKKYIPKEMEKEVEQILKSAFKRFLHNPNIVLRKMANNPEVDIFVSVLKRLFGSNSADLDINRCEYHIEKGIFK
ncbi:MAG: glutamyl-tRNA reductase [Epsilonproteobacteria bacterium]|nr:glutamyl-tRNA reductase [Campylobacterota bacterium]NPA89707.1 glutamyl-tRNA reductase [Campylobacterota bacterium]